ncbi:MAG: sulfotransferase [Cyanobacteria bacterium J06638_22]
MDIATLSFFANTRKNTPRDIHAYVIGTMKSGTTSLGRVLNSRYRTFHEALPRQSCLQSALFRQGKITLSDLKSYIELRDRYLNLELESSCFLLDWSDILVEQFPKAKFILPIREPSSWLKSMINQEKSTNLSVKASYWKILFDEYFKDNDARPEDKILLDQGVHSVSAYLKYWNHHHLKLINSIPEERLLILRTDQINQRIEEISDFLSIPSESFEQQKIRQNRTKTYHIDASKDIDQTHIKDSIRTYCSDSLLKMFPELYA